MSITPLSGPLLTGAPQSLSVLDYGLFRVHAGRDIGLCGYLIRTDAGEAVLVDTGLPGKYAADPQAATLEDGLDAFGTVLRCTADNTPAAQLALLGLSLSDIDLHIVTHTHIDHIGGLHDTPQAPMLIAAAERALPRPLYWAGAQPMTWPDTPCLTVSEDTQIGPNLTLLLVPGHAPGQLALHLTLPQTGPVLLTSDAISRPAEIAEGFAGAWNPDQARTSAARLMALAEQTGAHILYGHCPAQWSTIRKAPDSYA